MHRDNQKGFSVLITVLALLVVAGLGLGGWYVASRSNDNAQRTTDTAKKPADSSKNQEDSSDVYKNWQAYVNEDKAIAFKYPNDWRVDEGAVDASGSATKLEYFINLRRGEEVKYNNTVSVEILNQTLDAVAVWYDDYFAQSLSNRITKTETPLKDKQSVQYVVTNGDAETKLYLFAIGSKTYLFSSANEELNSQADASYWATFGKVLESLELTPSLN